MTELKSWMRVLCVCVCESGRWSSTEECHLLPFIKGAQLSYFKNDLNQMRHLPKKPMAFMGCDIHVSLEVNRDVS
ncbi:hypothetical protein Bpfe_023008, partial [Biomphalaria pfeifferi]